MVIVKLAAVGIYFNIVKAGMAEYLCIHMAAAIAPKVKFTAIYTKRNLTAVTEDNGRNFAATRAANIYVCYDDHGASG